MDFASSFDRDPNSRSVLPTVSSTFSMRRQVKCHRQQKKKQRRQSIVARWKHGEFEARKQCKQTNATLSAFDRKRNECSVTHALYPHGMEKGEGRKGRP